MLIVYAIQKIFSSCIYWKTMRNRFEPAVNLIAVDPVNCHSEYPETLVGMNYFPNILDCETLFFWESILGYVIPSMYIHIHTHLEVLYVGAPG